MPDKKLTDTEIKKALEIFVNSVGKGFVFANVNIKKDGINDFKHIDLSYDEIFDLINRLEAEIVVSQRRIATLEKLAEYRKKAVFERVERNLELRKDLKNANAENENLKAEVERLKGHQKDGFFNLLGNCLVFSKTLKDYNDMRKGLKAEAYKEFATKTTDKVKKVKQKYERLCKEQGEEMEEHMHIHFNGIIKIIKDILSELVGDGSEGGTV